MDEHGDATAVWAPSGRHLTIMAAVRPHGRRFGRPFELGRSGHFAEARPALAVGRLGDAVVAWNSGRNVDVVRRGPAICAARRSRGCFGAPVRLRAGADQTVAIGPLGSAYGPEIAVAAQPAGAVAFGAPTTMTPANVAAGSASLAVDPAGVRYLVYSAAAGTGATPGGATAISHVRPPGGAFRPRSHCPPSSPGRSSSPPARRSPRSAAAAAAARSSATGPNRRRAARCRRGRRAPRSASRRRRPAGRA
jgi:hypothetical protein